jgi:hypothetical protein
MEMYMSDNLMRSLAVVLEDIKLIANTFLLRHRLCDLLSERQEVCKILVGNIE